MVQSLLAAIDSEVQSFGNMARFHLRQCQVCLIWRRMRGKQLPPGIKFERLPEPSHRGKLNCSARLP